MHKTILFLLFFVTTSLSGQEWTQDRIHIIDNIEELQPILEKNNDTTYVINFWATWCGPCVKELPYFEALHEENIEDLKVVLVSLDFEKQLESRFLPYLNKNNIQSEVILFTAGKANQWIDLVDPEWSGAIPITIFRKGDKKLFYEQEFHSTDELLDIIEEINK